MWATALMLMNLASPSRPRKNYFGMLELRWFARVSNRRTFPQDAQKGGLLTRPTPARQDAPFRGQGRNSAADPRFTFHASRFRLPWNDARTKLADFFSILLEAATCESLGHWRGRAGFLRSSSRSLCGFVWGHGLTPFSRTYESFFRFN